MGRIADALARAERQRGNVAQLDSLPLSSSVNKWTDWYGTADTGVDPEKESASESVAPGPPQKGMSEEIISYYARSSMVAEQYRSLRTRLISANPYHEHRVFAITSAIPKEGKSVTTVNLGFSLAEIPHLKVLMVDGDFRHTSLAKLLNGKRSPGLAELLRDKASYEEVIQPTPVPGLFFLAGGKTNGCSAAELFSTRAARAVFARFQKDFHYTIVDTPPATTVADVGIIGQMTSGVIFVVRMHRTPEPLAKRAIKHLINNNVPVLGGLVIGDNDPAGGYGYQYEYYRYYRDENA